MKLPKQRRKGFDYNVNYRQIDKTINLIEATTKLIMTEVQLRIEMSKPIPKFESGELNKMIKDNYGDVLLPNSLKLKIAKNKFHLQNHSIKIGYNNSEFENEHFMPIMDSNEFGKFSKFVSGKSED